MATFTPAGSSVDMTTYPGTQSNSTSISGTENGFTKTSGNTTLVVTGHSITYETSGFSTEIDGFSNSESLFVNGQLRYTLNDMNYLLWREAFDTLGGYIGGKRPMIGASKLAGDDLINGTPGDDILFGDKGNDTFRPQSGQDSINGGLGLDTLVINGSRANYAVSSKASGTNFGGEGSSYSTILIERVKFNDSSLAFDLGQFQSAGAAARLITAVAGKSMLSDKGVVGEIIHTLEHASVGALVQSAIDSGLVANLAGGTSDSALVSMLYKNATGTQISGSELNAYLDYMHGNNLSHAAAIELVAQMDSTASQVNVAGLAQTGLEYHPLM